MDFSILVPNLVLYHCFDRFFTTSQIMMFFWQEEMIVCTDIQKWKDKIGIGNTILDKNCIK